MRSESEIRQQLEEIKGRAYDKERHVAMQAGFEHALEWVLEEEEEYEAEDYKKRQSDSDSTGSGE